MTASNLYGVYCFLICILVNVCVWVVYVCAHVRMSAIVSVCVWFMCVRTCMCRLLCDYPYFDDVRIHLTLVRCDHALLLMRARGAVRVLTFMCTHAFCYHAHVISVNAHAYIYIRIRTQPKTRGSHGPSRRGSTLRFLTATSYQKKPLRIPKH